MPVGRHSRRLKSHVLWLFALALSVTYIGLSQAGQERYDYDALGRLVRVLDEQGRVTQYNYDAAGNLLQVDTGATAQTLTVSGISLSTIRRNRIKQVQITGSGLLGASILADDPGLAISSVSISATTLSFTLKASNNARLGMHTFTLSNTAGTAQAALEVAPATNYNVTPIPLALLPDNIARQIAIDASDGDEAITFTPKILNTTIARITPSSITLAAGQTHATAALTGLVAGNTILRLSSSALVEAIDFPVYITTDAGNVNAAYMRPFGLIKGSPTAIAAGNTFGPQLAAPLGLVKGNPVGPSSDSQSDPLIAAPLGLVKGSPVPLGVGDTYGPQLAAPLGLVKGNPVGPSSDAQSDPLIAAPLGLIRGDPTIPAEGTALGPLLAPVLGVQAP